MFLLTMDFDDRFEYRDQILNIDMAYDNILLLFELFDDEEVDEYTKIFLSLQLLIHEYDDSLFDTYEEAFELFKYIMLEFLGIDLDEEKDGIVKVFDYQKDAELIYASFQAVYKMDLFDLKGKLHWKKFIALLVNLDDNSPFKKVIGYRTMKVPTEKEASREYIQHVRRMKQIHSLEDEKGNMNNVLNQLSIVFKSN